MNLNEDAIMACVKLVDRAGASEFEIGHTGDEDGPTDEPAAWYAHAKYQGARITSDGHPTPSGAAMGLAERLLSGATCRCTKRVTLTGRTTRQCCRWQLVGAKWEPGCDAPPLTVHGGRGDHAAMKKALHDRRTKP